MRPSPVMAGTVGSAPLNHDGHHGPVEVSSSAVTGFEAGFGDPTASLGVTLHPGSRTSAIVAASLKVPLTDTTDLGTGEWDVGGAFSLSHSIGVSTLTGRGGCPTRMGGTVLWSNGTPLVAATALVGLNSLQGQRARPKWLGTCPSVT